MVDLFDDETIRTCIHNALQIRDITDQVSLTSLGMDSLNFIRLIVELEDAFHINIEDADIRLDNFDDIAGIRRIVKKYTSESEAQS